MSMPYEYNIICLKRSRFADRDDFDFQQDWLDASYVVYWGPNRCGYTEYVNEAGKYTAGQIGACAGDGFDWAAVRIPRNGWR